VQLLEGGEFDAGGLLGGALEGGAMAGEATEPSFWSIFCLLTLLSFL
jgi:hypothetical protein